MLHSSCRKKDLLSLDVTTPCYETPITPKFVSHVKWSVDLQWGGYLLWGQKQGNDRSIFNLTGVETEDSLWTGKLCLSTKFEGGVWMKEGFTAKLWTVCLDQQWSSFFSVDSDCACIFSFRLISSYWVFRSIKVGLAYVCSVMIWLENLGVGMTGKICIRPDAQTTAAHVYRKYWARCKGNDTCNGIAQQQNSTPISESEKPESTSTRVVIMRSCVLMWSTLCAKHNKN